ncbi:hypothetical protein LXL04_012428 [Taraxacum kok-saghyz]
MSIFQRLIEGIDDYLLRFHLLFPYLMSVFLWHQSKSVDLVAHQYTHLARQKGCWDISETRAKSDKQLLEFLDNTIWKAGYFTLECLMGTWVGKQSVQVTKMFEGVTFLATQQALVKGYEEKQAGGAEVEHADAIAGQENSRDKWEPTIAFAFEAFFPEDHPVCCLPVEFPLSDLSVNICGVPRLSLQKSLVERGDTPTYIATYRYCSHKKQVNFPLQVPKSKTMIDKGVLQVKKNSKNKTRMKKQKPDIVRTDVGYTNTPPQSRRWCARLAAKDRVEAVEARGGEPRNDLESWLCDISKLKSEKLYKNSRVLS